MSNSGMFGASGSGDTSGFGGLIRAVQSPGSSERPYGGYFDEVADELERAFPEFNDVIEKVVVDRGRCMAIPMRDRFLKERRVNLAARWLAGITALLAGALIASFAQAQSAPAQNAQAPYKGNSRPQENPPATHELGSANPGQHLQYNRSK